MNKTLLDEFYSLAFRKKVYESIKELQVDLDNFLDYYNYRRTDQGYKLKENGYKTPVQAHLSKNSKKDLTNGVGSDKIKVVSVRDRKEVEEKSILAEDFIKPRSKKDEVLACQIVTTS